MSSWKEKAPGRFERPFDSIELFFLTLARATTPINREHCALNIAAQFRAQFSSEDVLRRPKNAWITMRYDHPEVASRAEGDTKVYGVPDALALEAWLQETFVVAADTAKVEDLVASIQPQSLATIHFFPQSSFAKPRRVKIGDEGKNLSPSRDEAASFATAGLGGDGCQASKAATKLISDLTNNMPSIGLPDHPSSVMSLTTLKIISARKALDTTVTMAVHSAMILATQQLATKETSAEKYTSYVVFDLRPGLPSPFNDSIAHATSLYMFGLPLVISPSTFAQNISQLREFYKKPLPPSATSALAPVVIPYTKGMTELAKQSPDPDAPAATAPIFSSLGLLDRYLDAVHGDVEIHKFYVVAEMDTRQITCHLWTWRGRMVLHASYNEAFYEEQFVQEFLAKIATILLGELGIGKAWGDGKK